MLEFMVKGMNLKSNGVMKKSEILSKTNSVHHAPKTYLRGSGNRYYKAGMVVAMGCGIIFSAFTPKVMTGKGRYD
eukprot:CAMPEP_0185251014 /NCGR_PEP_ID=MMETSP1359-20130426/68_1 /TAXON_ID=552665 /ORGANISM="Bigelowiella longifila, Strain CCMP242" /LENGTH=74 /DNA_ID=CAMNT_0027832673 /DNA_START=138 /DNA_END=362 /DNA_ORIENTATION=+